MTDLAKTISILRIIRGWSQGELAQEAGVTNSAISDYERGKVDPQTQTLQKLMSALGCPMSVLDQAEAFIRLIKTQMGPPGRRATPVSILPGAPSELDEAEERGMQAEIARIASEAGRAASHVIQMVLTLLARR